MKLIVEKNKLSMASDRFLRRAGYGYIRDRRSGQESYVRRLGVGFYPRMHIYFEEQGDKVAFNLHLDQKQPSYAGASAHNADYDGEVVAREIERLKNLITYNAERVAHDVVEGKKEEKKSWWKKIFKK